MSKTSWPGGVMACRRNIQRCGMKLRVTPLSGWYSKIFIEILYAQGPACLAHGAGIKSVLMPWVSKGVLRPFVSYGGGGAPRPRRRSLRHCLAAAEFTPVGRLKPAG